MFIYYQSQEFSFWYSYDFSTVYFNANQVIVNFFLISEQYEFFFLYIEWKFISPEP